MATRKRANDDGVKKTYLVIDSLNHDQEDYKPGDEVELTSSQAEPLLAAKVVKPKDA